MTDDARSSYEGFETLDALQKANLELLRNWKRLRRVGRSSKAGAPEAVDIGVAPLECFVAKARATGSRLSSTTSRDVAQAALDYWATELAAHHAPYDEDVDPRLEPFDPRALPALGGASPFIGLSPFLESDAQSYFGREAAAPALAQRIETLPIVIVQGPSGSGKSSLISAGLLPRLRRSGFLPKAPGEPPADGQHRLVHVRAAGRDPIATLVGAILPVSAGSDEVARRMNRLREAPEQAAALLTRQEEAGLLVVIDQFEEIFTLEPRAGDPEVLARALAALGPRHRVLIGIRDDFLNRLEKLPVLGAIASDPENRYTPPPLSPDDLRRVIEAPADRAGLRFEEGVVADLVRSVAGETAGLPLLQFTLARLWEAKRDNWVSREVAAEVGLPKVALRRTADALYEGMADENKERAERLFLKLVTPAAENEFVRRPQTRAELQDGMEPGRVDEILDVFTRAGLLRREPGAVPADDRFDVTHETLIRNWPRLRDWLVRFRSDNQRFWHLRVIARTWKEQSRDPGYLLSGNALRDAYAYRHRSTELDALIDESDRKQERERRRAKYAFALSTIAVAAALIMSGGFLYQRQKASAEADLARVEFALAASNADRAQKEFETQRITAAQLAEKQAQTDTANRRLEAQIDELSSAIQALGAKPGDLVPLRTFLERFGAAPALTAQLQLGGAGLAPAEIKPQLRREDFSETVVDSPSEQVAAPTTEDGSTCTGYLWIGDPKNSKVTAFPASPTGLDGKTLTVTSNIRLRGALPNDIYQTGRGIGIVPKGTQVAVQSDAITYDRPGGTQWWVRVSVPRQVCVTVIIQFAGDASKLDPFLSKLRGAGFLTAEPEALDAARNHSSVRYYFAADAPMAQQVADLFAAVPGGRPLKLEPMLNQQPQPSPGTIGVWIDLTAQESGRAAATGRDR